MPFHAVQVDRVGENSYEIIDNHNRKISIEIKDHHLLHLARMLGFQKWYPNLDEHLELSTESWVGTLLMKPEGMSNPFAGHTVQIDRLPTIEDAGS
jgi:hypothetical protein